MLPKASLPVSRPRPMQAPRGSSECRRAVTPPLLTGVYVSHKIFHIFHPKVFLVTSLQDALPSLFCALGCAKTIVSLC